MNFLHVYDMQAATFWWNREKNRQKRHKMQWK